MKVVILTTDLGLTGIPKYVESLAMSLPRVGRVQVEVIAVRPPLDRLNTIAAAGIRVHVLSPDGKVLSRAEFARRLKHLLASLEADCVHTHLWTRSLVTSLVVCQLGLPEVTTWHYWMHRRHFSKNNWKNIIKELFLAQVQQLLGVHFISIGSHIRRPGIIDCRITNILNGIPVQEAPVRGNKSPLVILQAAQLNPMKGQADLLRAVALLPPSDDFEVWLAGDGPSRPALEALINEKSLHHVRLLGWRDDIMDLMRRVDVAALPSYGEGLPLFVTESMMLGLPVVGYNIPPIQALVNDSCGVLVAPGDIEALSRALSRLLDNAELRRAMGAASHQRAVRDFADTTMATKTLAVYERACGVRN